MSGLYTELYDAAIVPRLTSDTFHGSEVRDAIIEYANGRWDVDDRADKWLGENLDSGRILAVSYSPTHSQQSFYGLQHPRRSPITSNTPGTREHWEYVWSPSYRRLERLLSAVEPSEPQESGPECQHASWSDPVPARWDRCEVCGYRGFIQLPEGQQELGL